MAWLTSTVRSACGRLDQETAGVSSKRERAKIVGALLTSKVTGKVATAHDRAKEHLHESRRAAAASKPAAAAGTNQVIRIEAIAAADLNDEANTNVKFLATCDAYCAFAAGKPGETWEEKCLRGKVATRVAPRQRNPRWAAGLELPLDAAATELTARVVDSKTVRSDRVLGELHVDLQREPSGAACRLLKSSGLAALSLRWRLGAAEAPLPPGPPAFVEASRLLQAQEGRAPAEAAAAVAAALHAAGAELAGELLLQAPLALLLAGAGKRALLEAMEEVQPKLGVSAVARLAAALMRALAAMEAAAPGSQEERLLVSLVQGLKGEELFEFKRLLGTAGCGVCLLTLVHRSVAEPGLREGLLSHFRQQAAFAAGAQRLHVLSDVDMTFSVGSFGCGGPKFPHGPVPGARPLLRALGGQLTFITARPQMYEAQTRRELLSAGVSEAGILGGDLGALLSAALRGKEGHAAMGERKARAFTAFRALHPEACFIFLGDSGEGDVDFAQGCFLESEGIALIHDVADEAGVAPATPAAARAELAARGVSVFDSYAGAALLLHEMGMLTGEGLRAAAQGCHDEVHALPWGSWASEAVRLQRFAELALSLDFVDEALRKLGLPAVERLLPAARQELQQLDDFMAGL